MIDFEIIDGATRQIRLLYILLGRRKYKISHQQCPSYKKHKQFVQQHPYRAWYLIRNHNIYVGSVYLSHENTIGVNVSENTASIISSVLHFLKSNYEPLDEISSVRPGYFYINVPSANMELQQSLEKQGCTPIQTSFKI